MHEKVYVAKIGKTVGLKGQLKLHIDSDFPEQFKKDAKFLTNKNIDLVIESFNKKNNVVKFISFDTIEDAQRIINQQLFVSSEDTKTNCQLDDKQFFWFDLVGCKILEDDKYLGKVLEIHRYPTSDYFEIKTSDNLIKENEFSTTFLLPYIEQYIINVNLEEKIITTKGALEILEAS